MAQIVDISQLPKERLEVELVEKVHEGYGGGPRGFVGGWWIQREICYSLIELLAIKLDGDNGLLTQYSSDLINPIFTADFITIKGKIIHIGETSRTVEFTVEKTIDGGDIVFDPAGDEEFGGGGRVLAEPQILVRGSAVFVVPKERQRKPLPTIEGEPIPAPKEYVQFPEPRPSVVELSQISESRLKTVLFERVHEDAKGPGRGILGPGWTLREAGWLVTELGIKLDGDSGLVAHYDVNFPGALYAHDWARMTAEIVSIGNTSRTMNFTVEKVVDAADLVADHRPGKEFGGGAVELETPEIVAQGQVVFVVPKDRQRNELKG